MQTLFVYGPPGSGKTTLGKFLAGRFGVPFEDLDDTIVGAADGKSIPAIFADEGEAGFRARERAALEAACAASGHVVALGGGALLDPACRALAEALFGDERAIIRIDMSEYMEKHATARLIGSPPGYVGHEEGGQLTEKVRRKPYSVVLFDEIEKAHEDVFNLLLQVMEDGRLTDSMGREVDFRNTVVVMTSNTGARAITDGRGRLGFSGEQRTEPGRSDAEIRSMVMEDLKRTFRPEFLNRVDEIIVFHRLTPRHLRTIAQKLLCTLGERMEHAGVHLTVPEAALELVAKRGYDPRYGARPLRRVIRSELEDPAAKLLLSGTVEKGDSLTAIVENDKIILTNDSHHDTIASES
jgi:ATP-dependent Clp protease ATP-binding subunit ClpC